MVDSRALDLASELEMDAYRFAFCSCSHSLRWYKSIGTLIILEDRDMTR